jgi:hypothetical protein
VALVSGDVDCRCADGMCAAVRWVAVGVGHDVGQSVAKHYLAKHWLPQAITDEGD